nr:MAG TPA: hypothetical protein [Caudoviricetes sp.]
MGLQQSPCSSDHGYGIDGEHLSTLKGACVVWVIRQLPALPLG